MKQKNIRTYEDAIAWIHGLLTFGIKPGLKRMEWMLEKLDHPERRLKFIHIAGTNGKGSTSSFLATVLRKAGYDVGLYTSPYLEKFTNRIGMNSVDIPEGDIVELVQKIAPLVDELSATDLGSPTEFEVVTTLAILYYGTKAYPDYVVWETGLGGRLDSTNVIHPVMTVITNVGMDHVQYLGETIEQIAFEKAGIIKAGVPIVTAVEDEKAFGVIHEKAKEKMAVLYRLGDTFRLENIRMDSENSSFDFNGPFRNYKDLVIKLKGEHQVRNAGAALMAIEVLRQYMALIVDEDVLRAGLEETVWPGRFEKLSDQPELIIDGAHNPHGTSALAKTIQQYYPDRTIHLMVGVLGDKPMDGFLEPLLPLVKSVTVTQPDFHRAAPAEQLAERVKMLAPDLALYVHSDWKKALEETAGRIGEKELMLITGTLYLISDVRRYWLARIQGKVGETP
jgi:dihydrofolate synthase/folylpolyglutamate synthase